MTEFRPSSLIACLILVLPSTGCGVFRAHRPMTVQVIDGETRQPLPNAKVSISYPNMLDFTAPHPSSRTTDSRGLAKLRIGEYRSILLHAEEEGYNQAERSNVTAEYVKGLPRRSDGRVNRVIELWADPRPTIELVVPNEYRGPVKIVFERGDGKSYQMGQRRFEFPVEPNGHVLVRGPGFLDVEPFHVDIEARHADGTPIPRQSSNYSEVALRWVHCGTWNNLNTQLYIIGTETEGEVLRQSVHRRVKYNVWQNDHEAYGRLFEE